MKWKTSIPDGVEITMLGLDRCDCDTTHGSHFHAPAGRILFAKRPQTKTLWLPVVNVNLPKPTT